MLTSSATLFSLYRSAKSQVSDRMMPYHHNLKVMSSKITVPCSHSAAPLPMLAFPLSCSHASELSNNFALYCLSQHAAMR